MCLKAERERREEPLNSGKWESAEGRKEGRTRVKAGCTKEGRQAKRRKSDGRETDKT